jgi:hypothetical protein
MGHADAKTTMRYRHHKSQEDETELLADAFRPATGASAALTHVAPAAIASSATHRSATPIS